MDVADSGGGGVFSGFIVVVEEVWGAVVGCLLVWAEVIGLIGSLSLRGIFGACMGHIVETVELETMELTFLEACLINYICCG